MAALMKTDRDAFLQAVTASVRTAGHPTRAQAAQRDKGSSYTFAAVPVPVLRDLAVKTFAPKDLADGDRASLRDQIWPSSDVHDALTLPPLYYRHQDLKVDPFVFPVVRHWIDRNEDWGHCDDLTAVIGSPSAGTRRYVAANASEISRPTLRKVGL